jgi:putative ABC transport system permease protein
LLSLVGGGLGLLLALWSIDLLASSGAATLPRLNEINLDGRVLGFTFLLSALTGVLFGLIPALQAVKSDVNESLKEGGRGSTAGATRQRFRSLTIIAEFALSLVLLIGAGLMIKSFWRLQHVDPGFNPNNVLTFQLSLPRAKYAKNEEITAFYHQAVERIKTLPGVTAVGATSILPLSGSNSDNSFVIEGRPLLDLSAIPDEELRIVTPDYFRAMNIPLIKGRYFADADTPPSPEVAIINQALARKHFSGEDPIGKRITMDDPRSPSATWITIVGIVGDVKHRGLNVEAQPELYGAHGQAAYRTMNLVARTTSSDPSSVASAIRREVAELDKGLPLYNTRTMERVVAESIAQQRLASLMLGILAALALTLASVGIFGVLAYIVTQRTHEIGIRMALGAQRTDILRLIIGQGMTLTLIGIALGLAGAFALTRVMTNLLYGVGVTDPLVFAGVPLLLAGIALLACYLPARRALRVDPLIALRYE